MRILLINKFHYKKGGAEKAYFDTARILAENGHEIAFFSMEHPSNESTPWSKFFVSQVEYLNEKQSFFSKAKIGLRIIWNFEASQKLEVLIKEFKPDIAHLHNTYHQLSPSILWTLKKHGVPIVMTLHDYKAVSPNYNLFVRGKIWAHTSGWLAVMDRVVKDSFIRSLNCAVEIWLHRLIRSYHLVNRFIAPSHFLIEMYRKLGFHHDIAYVPQPLSPFPSKPNEFGVGNFFLFVGRLSGEKGVQLLLEAFHQLPEEKLVIVGTGPDEEKLRQYQKDHHLANVTFAGYQTGVALDDIFRGAKAFLLPSVWYENMPYVMLEAFGFGKPVLGSNLGGIPERIETGNNGFLFEAGKVPGIIQAIQSFNTSNQVELSQNAWESIGSLHEETYYQELQKVYQEVLTSIDKEDKN